MKLSSLSILIPAYNVQGTIEYVMKNADLAGRLAANKLEIIVVDDASADATAQILIKLKKKIRNLTVISHPTNEGYGKTIKELYTRGTHEWLFSLPGDDQFDAAEINKLLPATRKADMILGFRSQRHDPKFRLFQSRTYNTLLQIMFGLTLHDVNTIRLMKKKLVDSVPLESDSAFVDAELAIRAARLGWRIIEIPVTHKKRTHKGATGGKLLKTVLPTIVDLVRTSFVDIPQKA